MRFPTSPFVFLCLIMLLLGLGPHTQAVPPLYRVKALPQGFSALDMNARGEFVGSAEFGSGQAPAYYSESTGLVAVTTFPGANSTGLVAINDAGQVVGNAVFTDTHPDADPATTYSQAIFYSSYTATPVGAGYPDENRITGAVYEYQWSTYPVNIHPNSKALGLTETGKIFGEARHNMPGDTRTTLAFYGAPGNLQALPLPAGMRMSRSTTLNEDAGLAGLNCAGIDQGVADYSFVLDLDSQQSTEVPFYAGSPTSLIKEISGSGQALISALSVPKEGGGFYNSIPFVFDPSTGEMDVIGIAEIRPGEESFATSSQHIDDRGWVVGGASEPGQGEQPGAAWLWIDGQMFFLKDLLAEGSLISRYNLHFGMDLESNGQILVLSYRDAKIGDPTRYYVLEPLPAINGCAIRYTSQAMPTINGGEFFPGDLNDRGLLSGAAPDESGVMVATVWNPETDQLTQFGKAPGYETASAIAINNRGTILRQSSRLSGSERAFHLIDADGLETALPNQLNDDPTFWVRWNTVNDDGMATGLAIVDIQTSPSYQVTFRAVRWSAESGFEILEALAPDDHLSQGDAINFAGTIAGVSKPTQYADDVAVIYPPGSLTPTELEPLPETLRGLWFLGNINNAGEIAASAIEDIPDNGVAVVPVIYRESAWQTLPPVIRPGGETAYHTRARRINDLRMIIGESTYPGEMNNEPFLFWEDQYHRLRDLLDSGPFPSSGLAMDLNNRGQVMLRDNSDFKNYLLTPIAAPPDREIPFLTISQTNDDFQLSWQGTFGWTYQIWRSPDLSTWLPHGPPHAGPQDLLEILVNRDSLAPQQYYKIEPIGDAN